MTKTVKTAPTPIPQHRDLLDHSFTRVARGQSVDHIVHFRYPDCIRSFDGKNWTVRPL